MKKEYHYSREERDEMHSPASDWRQGKRGEECISACSLDVSDIVDKHKVRIEPPKVGGEKKLTREEIILARLNRASLSGTGTSRGANLHDILADDILAGSYTY